MSSTMLNPQVIDASTLIPKATSAIYMPIAVEGAGAAPGTAVVGTPLTITRVDESVTAFGATSKLHAIIKAVLDRGASPVVAVASSMTTAPTLAQRQTAWEKLESDSYIRIRLTDSETQADLVALGVSCANANLLYNKQIAFVGMASGTAQAAIITAAGAIASGSADGGTRTVLVAPGVYDDAGILKGGSYLAACVAAEVAKNNDPGNDLDLWPIQSLTGIERTADTLPVFRRHVVAGVATDDFETLLQGGVSPVQPSRVPGGVITTHLRMAYTTNSSYDSLYTRVIADQVFLDVKNYIFDNNFFRAGNTQATRLKIKSGVQALLEERDNWIATVTQPDGTQGYNVTVTASPDFRQVIVGYEGIIVRGISTVKVAANLSIPV
jgi:hypothetical protein